MSRKSKNVVCSIESSGQKIADIILEEKVLQEDEVYGDNLYKITVYLNTHNSQKRIFRHDFATNVDDERGAKKSMIYPTSKQEYQNIMSDLRSSLKRQAKVIGSNINSISNESERVETTDGPIDVKNVRINQITLEGTKDNHKFRIGLSISLKFKDKNIKSKYKCNWLIIDKTEDNGFGYDDMFGSTDIKSSNLKDSISLFRSNL